jgi:ABC-type uncharacterized transport system involved in gliding motility auxiliary subunit
MVKKLGGIIGWIGTALVFGAVAIRFLKPDWDRYAYWGAWAGLVCVLVYTLSQWRDIAAAFRRRQTRFGTLTAASILIVLGILVAINYLGTRQNKRWDLTSSSEFTLSDQTTNVLAKLDAPLKVTVFEKNTDMQKIKDRLQEYTEGNKKVSAEYIDPDRQPTLARQYQVQAYGTVVFEYKGRTERVVGDTEQDLTNAIIKVVSGTQRKIYFLQGHGERDPMSADRNGYSTIKAALERENYAIERLPLIQKGAVPDDATVLVIAGPASDLLMPELAEITAFLAKGGKLLLMADPPAAAAGQAPIPNLESLARDWGVQLDKTIIVDASGIGQLFGSSYDTSVVLTYPQHPITERFGEITAFPLARSLSILTGASGGRTPQAFVETGPRSWAETDLDSVGKNGSPKFEAAKGDRLGPLAVGAAVSAPGKEEAPLAPASKAPETRVVVMGDSDFASNASIKIGANRDFFMNIVGWLSQQENLIAIRPREPGDSRLTLTADQSRRIAWLALLIIPGAIFALGIYTWWRRR